MRHFTSPWHHAAGFTLLELLVVMSLVGLMSGLIVPRLWGWIEGAKERAGIEALHSALAVLPVRTFFSGQALQIAKARDAALPLPPDWRLEISPPLYYEANGMASGGRVKVWSDTQLLADWQVLAPSGRLVDFAEVGREPWGGR